MTIVIAKVSGREDLDKLYQLLHILQGQGIRGKEHPFWGIDKQFRLSCMQSFREDGLMMHNSEEGEEKSDYERIRPIIEKWFGDH